MAPSFKQTIQDPRRIHAVQIRTKVESLIRDFFLKKDFLETRTPLLVTSPGMETHIRPFQVQALGEKPIAFLPTSPEFAMKKLLAGGLEKIFQICPAFRSEPRSRTHLKEFTMLEWYRAHEGFESIMTDSENLVESIAVSLFQKPEIKFQNQIIDVSTPWPRFKINDLFLKILNLDLGPIQHQQNKEPLFEIARKNKISAPSDSTWDDLYYLIFLNLIEPKLPTDRPCILSHYPASQAALSVLEVEPSGISWAKRFEFYIGGIELGNAFEELTDPIEQRKRFRKDMELRASIYGDLFPSSPIDETFIQALEEGLPPCSGIAVGVDRLVMLFADEAEIDYTFWLLPTD
jgi:lysyl-tRNA synthetase class 2